jgi:hypothetical protein
MARHLALFFFILSFATAVRAQSADPDFNFGYTILPKGNQTFIFPGGTIVFPDTTVNVSNPTLSQTNSATFLLQNHSNRSITVNNISSNVGAFTLSGLPLLPVAIPINQSLTFTINFQPGQLGAATGDLHMDFALRASVDFSLAGNGVGPVLAYDFITDSGTTTVLANGTLNLPQTNVGDKTTVTMRVRNTGNSDATISFLASSDPLFALSNVPFLPFTLQAGNAITFTITFAPTLPGTFTARLRIGDSSFNLSGVAVGVTLTYTAVVGSASTALGTNGTVIFTPTQVGSTSSAQVQISNTGNAAAFVNSISVAGPASGVFMLPSLPALPLKVDGGATVSFEVDFAPITLGQTTGSLKIDNRAFSLSGSGDPPPPLPGVSFSGSAAAVDAAQQIGIGVSLNNPYPVQLDGKLTLTFAPTADVFSDDPAIAFAAGGRTVNFIVPANSKNAVFGLSDSLVRFQTGTVAGTITLSATFTTDAGGINLTTGTAPATNISVRPSAPRITSVQLSNRTASAITVLITGYSPTRSANTLAFTFTPYVDPNNTNLQLATTKLNLAVDGPFGVWYRSAASQPFGSLFTATVTFNVFGDIEAIQSLAVTISNSLGTSNSGSVALR